MKWATCRIFLELYRKVGIGAEFYDWEKEEGRLMFMYSFCTVCILNRIMISKKSNWIKCFLAFVTVPATRLQRELELPLHWGAAGVQCEELQESLATPTRVYPSSHLYITSFCMNTRNPMTSSWRPWATSGGKSQSWWCEVKVREHELVECKKQLIPESVCFVGGSILSCHLLCP